MGWVVSWCVARERWAPPEAMLDQMMTTCRYFGEMTLARITTVAHTITPPPPAQLPTTTVKFLHHLRTRRRSALRVHPANNERRRGPSVKDVHKAAKLGQDHSHTSLERRDAPRHFIDARPLRLVGRRG